MCVCVVSVQDPSAVCQFTHSQSEQTSLKGAHSFVTESVTRFIFPHTRSRPPLIPTMPTLPEEEEDSPEELNSTSSSPCTVSQTIYHIRLHSRCQSKSEYLCIHSKLSFSVFCVGFYGNDVALLCLF